MENVIKSIEKRWLLLITGIALSILVDLCFLDTYFTQISIMNSLKGGGVYNIFIGENVDIEIYIKMFFASSSILWALCTYIQSLQIIFASVLLKLLFLLIPIISGISMVNPT